MATAHNRPLCSVCPNPLAPSSEDMLEATRRENEQLRYRLVDAKRKFIWISRLNEIYREELIQHRRTLPYYVVHTNFYFVAFIQSSNNS